MSGRPNLILGVPRELMEQYARQAAHRLDEIMRLDGFNARYDAIEAFLFSGLRPERDAAILAVQCYLASLPPTQPRPPSPMVRPEPPKPSTSSACRNPATEAAA